MRWLRSRRRPLPVMKIDWEEVFYSMHDGLIVLSVDGTLIRMNTGAEKLAGLSLEAVAGCRLPEAFPLNREVCETLLRLSGERRSRTLREVVWQTHQGGIHLGEGRVVDIFISPLLSDTSEAEHHMGWILVLRDVTPLKKMEEELRQSDRLATAGLIASGLAHEIKNPLGGIRGAAQLLARKDVPPDMKQCLDIIIKETTRVDHLVSELLTLGSPKRLHWQPLNINELLNEILLLQKKVLEEKKVTLIREYDPSLPKVRGDAERLTQAFLNFIQNAIAALETKGSLTQATLKVQTRMQNDFLIKGESGKDFRMVQVEIIDNGVGIAADDLERIFIPFFTTKKGGSGLGMAIAQGIIDQHQGVLKVTSEQGQGTTVSVTLRAIL